MQRQAETGRRGARRGDRDAENGVGAEAALVGRAVELAEEAVEGALVGRVHADDLGADGGA